MSLEKKEFNTFLESLRNTLAGKTSDSEINKSFDKLQENFSNSIKKTMPMEKNDSEIFSFNTSNINNEGSSFQSPVKSRFTPWFFFKYGLMAIIFFVLIINIYAYLKTGKDAITYYSNKFFNKTKKKVNNLEKNISNLADDTHDMIDLNASKLSEKESNITSKLQNTVESGLKNVKKTKKDKKDKDFFDKDDNTEQNIENKNKLVNNEDTKEEEEESMEDKYKVDKNYSASSVLDLKLSKSSGYCYVGSDRNVRTCVKINAGDKCMSGKVFPTENLCINPNLKE